MPATARAKEHRSENLHSKNKFNAERTNSKLSAVTNPALNSTTGSKPRKKYREAKKKRSPPNGEFITELPPQKKLRSSTA
jgi:hypothetical protein